MRIWQIFIFFLPLLVTELGHAKLGDRISVSEKSATFQKNQVEANAQRDAYTIAQVNDDGVSVTEYANKAGQVFAVKWQGESQPDLTVFLGSYYAEYASGRDANLAQNQGGRSHVVSTDNIQVMISGHMGSMRGFAYVRTLVPRGLKIEQLQ